MRLIQELCLGPDVVRVQQERRLQPARPECVQRVAAYLSMIDTPKSSRRNPPLAGGDAELEEARLRQQAIGVKLRHMFDQVVNEPVPDEFLDILRRADDRSGRGGE